LTSSERDIGLGEGTFLLVVNDDHASILHGYGGTKLQKFGGYEFDLLGSRDVIDHVTVGLGEILHSGSSRGRNHLFQILCRSVEGFRNFAILH